MGPQDIPVNIDFYRYFIILSATAMRAALPQTPGQPLLPFACYLLFVF
jgi:hypothetical protein